ncbi:NADH-quinone oxidoreductase subunit B family protein [Geoglobus acetivorans]|uniref:Methylviologen-reducing hydrogenase, subunit gamma (MvhG) n=1 Tax=Geoglobus acetivorans TaxID=565033 RepID=A0A0A7GFN4_GEOAI|nr:methylviologen-reducing hydrogenase, subunit gamma (MvhG) [Geoglobus acetivorans]
MAFYLASGCMGCEMAAVDSLHRIFDEFQSLEIVWSIPMFTSSKYHELDSIPDGHIDVAIIEGGVGNGEVKDVVIKLRKKSKKIIALGTCAVFGGVPALAAFHTVDEIAGEVFSKTRPEKQVVHDGKYILKLPEMEIQKPLDEVVEVDHYLPGCPPKPKAIADLFSNLKNLKEKWIISGKSVCSFCPRSPVNGGVTPASAFDGDRFVSETGENSCLLYGGVLCSGFITIGDCGADCLKIDVPCRGCYGPLPDVADAGGKMIDVLSIVLPDEAAEALLSEYREFGKIFYIYRRSLLKGGKP